jgi:hypothetical protein
MAEIGPLTITARNGAQAEYIVRSRAEQRGVSVQGVEVSEATPGSWSVVVTCTDEDVAKLAAAQLDEDTQVLHFKSHTRRPSG